MINFLKSSHGKTFLITILLSALFIVITFNYYIELSSFAVAISKATLALILLWSFDKFAMKEIDTITELKKGNTAYALFILALSILVSAAILGS